MAERERKEFDFGEWLSEGLEGMLGGRPRLLPAAPPEFTEHSKAAFKEMLLAYRSLVDAVASKWDKDSEQPVVRIKVE